MFERQLDGPTDLSAAQPGGGRGGIFSDICIGEFEDDGVMIAARAQRPLAFADLDTAPGPAAHRLDVRELDNANGSVGLVPPAIAVGVERYGVAVTQRDGRLELCSS